MCHRRKVGWLRRLIGLDQMPIVGGEADVDAVVWVATVALWQAPLVVHELAEQGIQATYAESSSRSLIYGGAPAARIYVHQINRATAERIILEVTRTRSWDEPT